MKKKPSIRTLQECDANRHNIRGAFTEIVRFELDRETLFRDLLSKYETIVSCDSELRLKFSKERGVGHGVCKEVFSLFWQVVEDKYMEGCTAKVPVITPDNLTIFFQLGRILSHGYILTGYLPLFLAKAFFVSLLPSAKVSQELLLASFLEYIDASEAEAVQVCLNSRIATQEFDNVVVPMLSRFNCRQVPSVEKLKDALLKVASYTLLSQPFYASCEIRRGMLAAHPQLWKKCSMEVILQAYAMLTPTVQRVVDMLTTDFKNSSQEAVFDFLRRFILSLKKDDLGKFLRFVTGKPLCGMQSIQVHYHVTDNEFIRRPTTHTCSNILSLPVSHPSITFVTFCKEFRSILENSLMWSFDSF